jgi:esterase/lipase
MTQTGVLLIHGLMGSPREYIPLETVLQVEGYQTRTVTLPGHGFNPTKPFGETSADEILLHCLREYNRFAEEHDEVIIVGHSLGGICTLLTAASQPEKLAGVVALATPFEHAYWVNRTLDLAKVPLKVLLPAIRFAPECNTGFERPEYHPLMLPRLIGESKVLFSYLQERLQHITVPVCLAHSIYDLSIPYNEMNKLAGALVSAPKVFTHTLDRSGHQIFPISQDREKATMLILDFLHEQAQRKPRRYKTIATRSA